MRRPEPWFVVAEVVLRPLLALWFNWRFEGMEHIPRRGPVLIACNHMSVFDPLAHAYMMVKAGRRPRFLAKSELFASAFLRAVLKGAGQIPVYRGTGSAEPLEAAKRALREGEAVLLYPEGTVTGNPDFLPMAAKTGVARLALACNLPVVPVAVWGSQYVWRRGGARNLAFGRPITLRAGAPLDFSELSSGAEDPGTLRKVTDRVMEDLTRLVRGLRGRYPSRWR
ncbi:MAG: 1-acyl-sn-glycerol-3-phosphate acyltransferase [Actinobacteria bacterium]|nr:1-acyl-sn-glycerol-3-phosphate acyltransferase [Actinomycetota bacterium]